MARTPIDITVPDLTGRRAVVTGGSDGVGLVVARRLAAAGAEVVLPVSGRREGEAAVAAIRDEVPGAVVSLRALDQTSVESVLALAAALRAENQPIGILVGTATVAAPPDRRSTRNGCELQFGADNLAWFALVARLLPLLRAGGARVTSQVGRAARRGGVNWVDPNWDLTYSARRARAQSAIALGLFGLELQRRSRAHDWGITSTLAQPGPSGRAFADVLAARRFPAGTPETAALPVLHAATSPDAEGGALYGHLGEQRLHPTLSNPADARRLWQLSEELSGVSTAAFEPATAGR